MPDERPQRSDADARVDLRLAAIVAAHEQHKWDVVREVIRVLDRLGAADGKPGDEPAGRPGQR